MEKGPWLTLADQLMCHLMVKVSWSWTIAPMNIEVMYYIVEAALITTKHPKHC
jgi:hypothetical protein